MRLKAKLFPPLSKREIAEAPAFGKDSDWDADLVAAREACHHKIDFSALLPRSIAC